MIAVINPTYDLLLLRVAGVDDGNARQLFTGAARLIREK